MSQENVAAVQAALNAFARDGLDGFAEYWTDDIDWRAVEGALDDRGPISREGRDARLLAGLGRHLRRLPG
jgi:hypothetical protein